MNHVYVDTQMKLSVTTTTPRKTLKESLLLFTNLADAYSFSVHSHGHALLRYHNNRYPKWNAVLSFERLTLPPTATVQVCDGNTVLGVATVNLTGLSRDVPRQQWYRLMPSPAALVKYAAGLASLRATIRFSRELILPFECYRALVELLETDCTDTDGVLHGLPGLLDELLLDQE